MTHNSPMSDREILLLARCYELVLGFDSVDDASSKEEHHAGNINQEAVREDYEKEIDIHNKLRG